MSADETLQRAENLRREGRWDLAVDVYRLYLDGHPSDVEARRKLAEVLVKLGKIDGAISNYIKVQEILAGRGDILGAIAAGLKVLETDPHFENPLSHLAKAQTERLQAEGWRRAETEPYQPPKTLFDIPLLYELNPAELKAVARKMRRHEVEAGEAIFEEGDEGDSIFFVHRGLVEISSGKLQLGRLGPGECLGEFSFLTRGPRTATVRAMVSSELLELSADDMDAVVRAHPRLHELLYQMYRDRALANVLARSPLFEMLGEEDRQRVADRVELVTVKKGETVVRRGEGGGALYLIKKGRLEVRAEAPNGKEIRLATLSPHQFFGEVSFLTGVPRTATVNALEECQLLKLDEGVLRRLAEDHPGLTRVLKRYHLNRVMATAETLKAFLKKKRVEGVLR